MAQVLTFIHVCNPPVARHVTLAVFLAGSGMYPDFVDPKSCTVFFGGGASFMKKNTKLGTKVFI